MRWLRRRSPVKHGPKRLETYPTTFACCERVPESCRPAAKKGLPRATEYRPSLSRNRSSVRRDSLISDHRSTAMEYSTTRLFPSAALTHVSNVAAPVVPQLSDPICLQVHAP